MGLFNFFRRKKPSSSAEARFPFFASQKELEGTKALPLLRQVEAELEHLQQRVLELSEAEEARYLELKAQYQALLGSGQVVPEMATHLVVSAGDGLFEQTHESDEWLSAAPTAHVLLVEDDHDLAEMLRFCLERIAGEVTLMHDGQAALQWIASHEPLELISLDLMLPRTDGLQLLKHIRAHKGWENVPIIVVSSKTDEATMQQVLQAGADVYLTKPMQPDAYLAQVEKLLARS